MPEGDSYTGAARRASAVLLEQPLLAVAGSSGPVRRLSRRLLGDVVGDVRTHGKHLMVDMASGLTIHVRLGMSGRVRVSSSRLGAVGGPVTLGLGTEAGSVRVLGAPDVDVARRAEIDHRLRHLGPDVLGSDFDPAVVAARARGYRPGRTASDLLLDQRLMAGVGNVYKAEVLFLEGIDPRRRVGDLATSDVEQLARRARTIMQPNAHRVGRSTTGRRDAPTWVYGRAGEPCRRCRHGIREDWIGDPPRVTYWCPACQT